MATETVPFAHRFAEWTPLARGAEGHLFRVRDRWTGHLGALKVAETGDAREALLAEFRLLSFLRHPCLIRSENLLGEGDARAHLLEYVPAVPPERLWEEGGEEAIRAALTQALRALAYLHRRGFVHGDVAPGNILVWREGARWRAKLADLGFTLSKAEAARSGVRGTPGFWAPESARGEGLTGASDLYALAATAYAWIEGRGPWEGAGSGEILRALAAGPPVPRPRRRIAPELEALLAALGSPDPRRRTEWDWAELRREEALWGPPLLTATVSGLEPFLGDWVEWARAIPEGSVGSILLRGRVGSGRKTAAQALGRALIAEGWMGIWDPFPRVSGEQGAREVGMYDPVLVARELGRQAEGQDVVLSWPERAGDLDVRVLRAFLAAREDASAAARTLVLKAGPIEGADLDGEWLQATTRGRVEEWISPGHEALASMQADLFAPEEGVALSVAWSGERLPLALILHKQGLLSGKGASRDLPADEAVEEEMSRLWERASPRTREALALLSWSDEGWALEELGAILGWERGTFEEVMAELDSLRVTRRSFEREKPTDRLTDEMTRAALLRRSEGTIPEPTLDRMARLLDAEPLREGDLGLVRLLLRSGRALPHYLLRSLDESLAAGRYGEMLEFGHELEESAAAGDASLREPRLRVLRAAQRAGKYEDEVRILRRLILTSAGGAAVEERKMLAQALARLGDWQGALEQCSWILEARGATEGDRIWAALERAEILWQAGHFADADKAYEAIEPGLTATMAAEWLRFAVGRARQHGQRGDMAGVKRYLDLAEAKVGKERCEQDPMYLNTLGGLLIERAEFRDARPLLSRASEIAESEHDWEAYIMISSRAGSLIYDLGDMQEAARIGRKGLTTAEAMASARMLGFTSSYQGYPETQLGKVGSAWRRAQRVLDLSKKLSDVNLEILGHRLRVFVASNVGLVNELNESVARARAVGERIGEKEILAFVLHYSGVFHLGSEEFDEASKCFDLAREAYSLLGQEGGELKSRLYLLISQGQSQFNSAGVDELERIQEDAERKNLILLVPIAKLARLTLDQEFRTRNPDRATEILLAFWSEGRLIDLLQWASLGLLPSRGGVNQEMKGKVLSAVQKIAESLDDAQLRREFLAFARTRRTLKLLSG